MRFHYGESMTDINYYVPLAKKAEQLGYSGFTIPDSLIYPKKSETLYSYTEDGGREFLENKAFVEAFILATAVGVTTTSLELTTNVVKLPVRPPLYSAKLCASIAALIGDRFNFGVGLSVWPEDYAAMGVDYKDRGKRFDECIEIVRGLCAGGYYEFHGKFYDLAPVKLNPVPGKPLPILIGGHSDAALKRAARNDGFLATGMTPEELAVAVGKISEYRKDSAYHSPNFRIFATTWGDNSRDYVLQMQDAGVTDLVPVFRNSYAVEMDSESLEVKFGKMERFAEIVMSTF